MRVHVRKQAESLDARQASGEQFRFFAASFNAGNHAFSDKDALELLHILTAGHDEPGREADLIFVGLQEYHGPHIATGTLSTAASQKLWGDLSVRSGRKLVNALQRRATASDSLQGQKSELAGHLAAFHDRLGAGVDSFTQRYGPDDDVFHAFLDERSHTHGMQEHGRLLSGDVASRVAEINKTIRAYKTGPGDGKFDGLIGEAENVTDVARSYDAAQIMEHLEPIREWTSSVMEGIDSVRNSYPNMVLNQAGQSAMQSFLSSVNNVDSLQTALLNHSHMDRVTTAITHFHSLLAQQVEGAETEMSLRLHKDIVALSEAAEHLLADVRLQEGLGSQRIADAASQGAEFRQNSIRASAELWANQSRESLGALLQPASLEITGAHLDIQYKEENWNSGWVCYAGDHFDTTLLAFVNPWSPWNISQVHYSSSTCKKASDSLGCSIDNNVGWECGKVVNLQVFEAQKGSETIRVCAMNTHMSFSNSAENRMRSIQAAVSEANAANCDSVTFVGDFNSRLHCTGSDWRINSDEPVAEADEAPYNRLDPATNSSLNYVMNNFCNDSHCSISGPNRHWDELTQMLEASRLLCYEEGDDDDWIVHAVDNTIPATGLHEAAPVDFAPTYKLKPRERASEYGVWARCLGDDPTCFVNSDEKGKHNPAWTDRILLQNSDRVSLSTTEYSRRTVPASFDSDHAPVVAQVTVELV